MRYGVYMPNDYVTIKALSRELHDTLVGGKIEKIYEPEKDEINMSIHNNGRYLLVISSNAENPRINITSQKKENPISAPMFCMRLRKELQGGTIEDIDLVNDDRIIDITIKARNELRDTVTFHLISEMMGRYSNIMLTDENMTILGAIKTISFDTATKRCLLPSMPYTPPPNSKLNIEDSEGLRTLLTRETLGSIAKYMTNNISGLAYSTAQEIVSRAGIDNNATILNNDEVARLISTIELFLSINDNELYAPCVLRGQENKKSDYFILPYTSLSDNYEMTGTLNEAIDSCLISKDRELRQHEKTKKMRSSLKKFRDKNMRTLQKAREKLIECEKIDTYQRYGEFITNSIYLIKRGDKVLKTYDYYDNKDIEVPLNPLLTPQGNAQDYYKRYAKLKRTKDIVSHQIEELERLLVVIQSIDASIDNCYSSQDIYELEKELYKIGAIKRFKTDKMKERKESSPYVYNINGFTLKVGKNNVQNDHLTFHSAKANDIWLHAKDFHGSHGILYTEGLAVDDDTVRICAEIVLFYSKARNASLAECDYTERRNVKKQQNYSLGLVNYVSYKSIRTTPNAHRELLIVE